MRTLASFAASIVLGGCGAPAASSPPAQPSPAAPTATASEAPPAPAPAPAHTGRDYPKVRLGDTVDTFHGVAVKDPYRWLEATDSDETRKFVDEENNVTDAYIAKLPGRETLRARLTELLTYESFGSPFRRGKHYFWTYRDGKHSQPTVWTAASLDGKSSLLLDPNEISTDGSLAFGGLTASQDGARIAYGLAAGGGDWHTWRVRDVATGKDLPDQFANIKYYAPQFTPDGTGIYYAAFPTPPAGKELTESDHDCKLYFHRIGTPVASDKVVYERTDHPTWQYQPHATRDGRYLVLSIGDGEVGDRRQEQIYYIDLRHPGAPVALIDKFDFEYEFIGNDGPSFYFITNLDADNKRIIAIDTRKPARDHWTTVVAAGPEAIETAALVGHQLLITTLRDAHNAVTAYDLHGKKLRDVELPSIGSLFGFGGAPEDADTFYVFASFTAPASVYRYNLATGKSTLWKAPKVPFDAGAFETTQVFFPSKDGTKVPMFVTAKKGLPHDGNNPTIMTAYGFGGISNTPWFNPTIIPWLERGGISVLVNIRGGGEYGEAWHHASYRVTRHVGFDDFNAAGDWLVANKLTSPAHLGAVGGSGGGLLVAGALMQRPELYGAVIPLAGVHDLLRFQLFGEGAGWQADLGSIENADEFKELYATSPLHNVRPGTRYPATLIVTADHDVRVAPLHSYKLAAAMQAAQAGPAPILLRVATKSGHGGGTTIPQQIEQQTEHYAFFAANLGMALQ